MMTGLRIMRLVAFAVAIACSGLVRAGEIRSEEYRDLARRSVNILDTYHAYRQAFEEKRAKRYDSASGELSNRKNTFLLFLEFNPMVPGLEGEKSENEIDIQTNAGKIHSFMQKSYGAANFSYFFPEYEMGVYAIADIVELFAVEDDNPGKEYLFKGAASDEPLDFSSGYVVVSGFFYKQGQGIDLGCLLRFEPFTYRDSLTGQEGFRFERQSDGTYEGTRIHPELFAGYHDRRIDVNTLYSLSRGVELIGLGLVQPMPRGFELEPFLRYFQYKTRFQSGAGVHGAFSERLDTEMEFANDLHRNSAGRFEYFHHWIFRNKLAFFRMKRKDMPRFSRYDFFMTLGYSFSISSDILEERVAGHSGGIAFENIFGALSLFVGAGYNEYKYLSIFPFKDSFTIDLKAQIGW
jgi:hypothetical protein